MWLADMKDAGMFRHMGVTNLDALHLIMVSGKL